MLPCLFGFAILLMTLLPAACGAEVLDRVVAYIDREAITDRELDIEVEKVRELGKETPRQQVLNTVINRRLMLREARAIRIEGPDEESLISQYIRLKVGAYIIIKDSEIRQFYEKYRERFGTAPLADVRDMIQTLLYQQEINVRLNYHLEQLKMQSEIRIIEDQEQDTLKSMPETEVKPGR